MKTDLKQSQNKKRKRISFPNSLKHLQTKTNQSSKPSVSEQSSIDNLAERKLNLKFEFTFHIICESLNRMVSRLSPCL